jgi:hypothetical protein
MSEPPHKSRREPPKKKTLYVCAVCGCRVKAGVRDNKGYPVDDMGYCMRCFETKNLKEITIYGY